MCMDDSQSSSHDNMGDLSQISGPLGRSKLTPLSQIGFRDPARCGAGQQLTFLSIEVRSKLPFWLMHLFRAKFFYYTVNF